MRISIDDIVQKLKNDFPESKAYSIESVYEKTKDSNTLKLVIFLNRILYKDISILYTKIIFYVDKDKTILIKNNFTYLYTPIFL